jgi:hypothetical protein
MNNLDSIDVHEDSQDLPTINGVENIILESKNNIPTPFYKNINPSEEFGVSRFIADRMAYLPILLENTTLTFIQDYTYLVSAELKDKGGNSIKLEHRFKSTSDEDAEKLYEKISAQMAGIQQKIWLACWRLANELRRFTFNYYLTDLMKIAYPEREGYFSVSEKVEFYDHIKSLEQTKISFSKPQKKRKDKIIYQTFEIPLLQIVSHIGGESDKYPQQLTLSILNPLPNPGKMAFVGAPFKHKTLELHADDTQLAAWIQTRKGQRSEEKFIFVELDFLLKLAGLERTCQSNKRHAKRLLMKKLNRFQEKGIILAVPERLSDIVRLKIR